MEKDNSNPPIIRILIVGDKLAGKTQLFWRYIDGIYNEALARPMGVEFKVKIVTSPNTNKAYKIQLWDLDRPGRFVQPRTQTYYLRLMGIIFVLDLTNRSSFEFLRNELKLAEDLARMNTQKILVGTKSDDAANRKISAQEAQEFAASYGMPYFEVSALADQNVTQAFTALLSMIEPKLPWDSPPQVTPPNTGQRWCALL